MERLQAAEPASGPFAPTEPTGQPKPQTDEFRGMRMLYIRVPLPQDLKKTVWYGGIFGQAAGSWRGAMALDTQGSIAITIAHYPNAKLAWSGIPGESAAQNVPHYLLSVMLPILYNGRKAYQTCYALTNDDIAMLLLRLGDGVPAKLSNFSFPAGSLAQAASINITRRGEQIFLASGIQKMNASAAPVTSVASLFDHTELTWGTHYSNYLSMGKYNTSLLERVSKVNIQAAWPVKVALQMSEEKFEGLGTIFGDLEPLEAWWVEGDLTVTNTPVVVPSTGPPDWGVFANFPLSVQWHEGGKEVTDKKANKAYPKMAYMNGEMAWISMKINKQEIGPYVPPACVLAGDEGYLYNVYWKPADVFQPWGRRSPTHPLLEYNELWVVIPVLYKGRHFQYPIQMLLDEDVAVVSGHDVMGCQKKMANMTFLFPVPAAPGGTVHLSVDRKGRPTFNLTAKMGPPIGRQAASFIEDPATSTVLWMVSQQFPRDPDQDRPMYQPARPTNRIRGHWDLHDIEISLGSSAQEPLSKWFVGSALRGGFLQYDQDWSADPTPPVWHSRPDAESFVTWWKQNYQVLYM